MSSKGKQGLFSMFSRSGGSSSRPKSRARKALEPVDTLKKQRLLSYQSLSQGPMLTRRNPTLNRLQNLLLHQRNLQKLELIKRQRVHQSFVLAKLRQLASPRLNRVKTSLLAIPTSKTFRMVLFVPTCLIFATYASKAIAKRLVYVGEQDPSTDQNGGGNNPSSGPSGGKSWYQISKVRGVEGTYSILGYEFRSPQMVLLTGVRSYMGGVIKEVLADDKVNQEGLNFLDRAFRHPQTHEAGQFMLVNVLKDARFIEASKVFGTDLIAWVILQDKAQEEFKKLVVKTLADNRVQRETVQVLKYITDQKESEEILAQYMKTVFLRKDVLDNLTQLLINGAVQAVEHEKTTDTFVSFLLGVVQNSQVRDGVLESLLYSPMRSFFTFGYGGTRTDEDQAKFELQMDEKRAKAQAAYVEDRDQRNAYPGLEKRMASDSDDEKKTTPDSVENKKEEMGA